MEGATLPGNLRGFYFDIHIWFPVLYPEDVANLSCGTEKETSVHILCECEALASRRHAHLGSFFLDLEDIRKLRIGAIWNCGKGTGTGISRNRLSRVMKHYSPTGRRNHGRPLKRLLDT
jgi:hypothetical protein